MNLNRLITLPYVIRTIPFSVYFFSCNLDHVICGNANLTEKEKRVAAKEFRKKFGLDITGFLAFFRDADVAVGTSYDDSWSIIKQNTNSLKRSSNLHVFLSSKAARKPRDFTDILHCSDR